MHILWSAAEPQLEGNGGFLNSNIKDFGYWCIMEQLRPPKDIQGRSWNEEEEESFIIRFSD